MAARGRSDTVRAIEERAMNAWPAAQSVLCDGWVLRLGGGFTKRANSANALAPTGSFTQVQEMAETLYPRRGLPVVFRLSPLAGDAPEAALRQAGYRRIDETIVMTAPVGVAARADGEVRIAAAPERAWLTGIAGANGVSPAQRERHDRLVSAIALPAAFASLCRGGEAVAYGLAVAERGMVGLFDVVTAPRARRQGLGRRLAAALLDWGRRQGAEEAYLQVVAANAPALGLYGGLGFTPCYRYHYRVRP